MSRTGLRTSRRKVDGQSPERRSILGDSIDGLCILQRATACLLRCHRGHSAAFVELSGHAAGREASGFRRLERFRFEFSGVSVCQDWQARRGDAAA